MADTSEFIDFNRTMTRGDTHYILWSVVNSSDLSPIDITTDLEYWLTGKIRLSDTDMQAVFQLTDQGVGPPITRTSLNPGKCQAIIPTGATTGLPNHDTLVYVDIQRKDASGHIFTLARGTILVEAEVTVSTS